jgi:hypothetical protein
MDPGGRAGEEGGRGEEREEVREGKEREEEEGDDPGARRELYWRQFLPSAYMAQYYRSIDPEEGFFLTFLHSFFQSAAPDAPRPRTVLEVGSGPLISGLASASGWADLLIYSDLLPANLAFLRGCLAVPGPARPALAFIAELEGEPGGWRALIGRLASTPLLTAQCDLLRPRLLPSIDLHRRPAVIVTKLCIEFATDSPAGVGRALAAMAGMLGRPRPPRPPQTPAVGCW